jgi:hypothetical protein
MNHCGIDHGFARIERMPTDRFRKESVLIRLIRGIRGLFPYSLLEIALGRYASGMHQQKFLTG